MSLCMYTLLSNTHRHGGVGQKRISRAVVVARFWHQRSVVQNQSLANFYVEHLFTVNNCIENFRRDMSKVFEMIYSAKKFKLNKDPLKISFSDNVACCVSLLPSKWWSESGRTNSVWPDGNIIFNILPLKSVKNWPILTIKIAKVGSKYCQILTCTKIQPNTYKILTKLLNWAKPGHTVCVKNFYASKNKTRIRI